MSALMNMINMLVVISFSFLMPNNVYALTVNRAVDNLTHYLTGDMAKAVGVLAIVISGYMCFSGRGLPKKDFGLIVLGLGIILGGSQIYTTLVS